MGALDPGPWAELQVSGAIPATGICPSRLPCSGSTFLLLLALPPPCAPSCSLRSGFPVAANNVLIHLAAGIWRRGEGPGAEEEEGGRQRSECACPGPAIQLRLKALCGAFWLSAPPAFLQEQGLCALVVCPPALLECPPNPRPVSAQFIGNKYPASIPQVGVGGRGCSFWGSSPEGCTVLIRHQKSSMGFISPTNTVRLFTAPTLV